MSGGTLTPLHDGVHLKGQGRVIQGRLLLHTLLSASVCWSGPIFQATAEHVVTTAKGLVSVQQIFQTITFSSPFLVFQAFYNFKEST